MEYGLNAVSTFLIHVNDKGATGSVPDVVEIIEVALGL